MADRVESLLKLQSWLSPAFPAGAFSYSHGLEWVVETGAVRDLATLSGWLEDVLQRGGGRNDAILITEVVRSGGDAERVAGIAELALALAPTRERFLESAQQGASFRQTIDDSWSAPGKNPEKADMLAVIAYPIAFGMAVRQHGIALADALPAYLNAFLGNLVSAAIRLSVIGQNDGQALLHSFLPRIAALAREAEGLTLEDIANSAPGVDFASAMHETQYSRLFRS